MRFQGNSLDLEFGAWGEWGGGLCWGGGLEIEMRFQRKFAQIFIRATQPDSGIGYMLLQMDCDANSISLFPKMHLIN